ncbi:MAG: tyrosine-type recombinase/integrase [Promethearchaeota archaeon]
MELRKSLQGLIISRSADGVSPHTITVYKYGINKLINFLNNPNISSITKRDIQDFFIYLREKENLAESSIRNIMRAIKVLFKWAELEPDIKCPDFDLSYPKASSKHIEPFHSEDIKRLLIACEYTKSSQTKNRKAFRMHRPTAKRDKAIILTLLDTGLRVSELSRLTIADLDLETGQITVTPFGSGLKSKPRTVFIGKLSKSTLWRYLASRNIEADDFVFISKLNRPMDRHSIRKVLKYIGDKAEIQDVYPHRFRHTFAIQYLRNDGDIYTLQRILGHSSLEMVKRYLAIAKADCQTAHRKASPVDNWKL